MAVVHQLLHRFCPREPATESAIRMLVLLRRLGHWGELIALDPSPEARPLVRHPTTVRIRRADWVFAHHQDASDVTSHLLLLGCQRALVLDGHPARSLSSQAQLTALAGAVAFSLAPSAAAAQRLLAAGHPRVLRVPPFVEAERFGVDAGDPHLLAGLQNGASVRVCVGGASPGEVRALQRELLRLRPDAQILLLGPAGEGQGSFRQMRHRRGVLWLEGRRHAERVAALRSAHVFLCLAEDDLTGQQVLEAMAAEVPVLAYSSGASAEALGGAGVAFTEKRFAFLAELVVRLAEDTRLRARLLAGQRRRLTSASPTAAEASLRAALSKATLAPAAPRSRPRRQKPRVAFVVQRYGEVTGGAEALARSLVQRLAHGWDITVLTTCAKDHLSWRNVLPPGTGKLDGVQVQRFPTRVPREMTRLNALSRRFFGRSLDRLDEERWLAMQGPLAPGLWRHLAEEGQRYDGFVIFTYLYASTAWSIPLTAERTLLVPTAHDEPPLAFGCFREVFERPRALLANTPEERDLIARRFPHHARLRVVGAGVDALGHLDPDRFRRRFKVARPYLLYVGRVEAGKAIPELLSFHASLRLAEPNGPDLLLAGDASLSATGTGVRLLGRINEQDKWDALAGALAVVVPSRLESLSLLALEAFAVGTPVVGNSASDVVRGQLQRSRGGRLYRDAASFREAVAAVSTNRPAFGANGRRYAAKHRWTNVVQAYREEMKKILEAR